MSHCASKLYSAPNKMKNNTTIVQQNSNVYGWVHDASMHQIKSKIASKNVDKVPIV